MNVQNSRDYFLPARVQCDAAGLVNSYLPRPALHAALSVSLELSVYLLKLVLVEHEKEIYALLYTIVSKRSFVQVSRLDKGARHSWF